MVAKDAPSTEGPRAKGRFGLCLPCHGCLRAPGRDRALDQNANPFSLLRDLRGAYTLLPIQAYWFSGSSVATTRDLLTFASHESVHLFLGDTQLALCARLLTQLQFLTLVQTAIVRQDRISYPSLEEPSGVLRRAQDVLDAIDVPLTLV
jgi:hypothetical protein